MNVNRYTPSGRIDTTKNLRPDQADRAYSEVSWQAREPFAPYYRVTLTDPLAGDRIVKDTDHEFFGRQTMAPRIPVQHGFGCAPYGNGGE